MALTVKMFLYIMIIVIAQRHAVDSDFTLVNFLARYCISLNKTLATDSVCGFV